jgi:hypothetical protein
LNHFCTYFDKNFFLRGITAILSIKKNLDESFFTILCLDDFTYENIKKLNLDNIYLLKLSEICDKYKILKLIKKNRSLVEFYFALTPFLIDFCLKNKKIKQINYIDADLIFVNDFANILSKSKKKIITLNPHRFSRKDTFRNKINGMYNVGFLSFKKSNLANNCINLWKKQCTKSTSISPDLSGQVCGDQLYLNEWPKLFGKQFFFIINDIGFGPGAWNLSNYNFIINNRELYINKKKLKMLHCNFIDFYNLRLFSGFKNKSLVNNYIYEKYKETFDFIKKKNINLEFSFFCKDLLLLLKNFINLNVFMIR